MLGDVSAVKRVAYGDVAVLINRDLRVGVGHQAISQGVADFTSTIDGQLWTRN